MLSSEQIDGQPGKQPAKIETNPLESTAKMHREEDYPELYYSHSQCLITRRRTTGKQSFSK